MVSTNIKVTEFMTWQTVTQFLFSKISSKAKAHTLLSVFALMSIDILPSFAGVIQASVSVLLTIFYGVVAGQIHLLDESAAKKLSRMSVKMLLPALLVVNLGSELKLDTAMRYLPILVWALFYNLLSQGIGVAASRAFNFPRWVSPAIAFNNTTSLPLQLMQSLGSTGILSQLLWSSDDSISDIVTRAKSYFLVSSVVGNAFTFGLGREMLGVHDEDPTVEMDESLHKMVRHVTWHAAEDDLEQGDGVENRQPGQGQDSSQQPDERTSLLPNPVRGSENAAAGKIYEYATRVWDKLPSRLKRPLARASTFISPPVVGALLGVVLGITPPLHRLFFADTDEGGYFNAWLTTSIKNIGDLFVALQVVVVGVKLAHSLRRMRRGESSGSVPWGAVSFTLFIRFIFWPIVSIAIITALAAKTSILSNDPVLPFTMMLMPTGPSAMKLESLAEVDQASDEDKMAISRFLTVSYAVSPLISLAVVGSMKAVTEWAR